VARGPDGRRAAIEVKSGRLPELPGGGAADLRWRPALRIGARRLRRLQRAARTIGAAGVVCVEIAVVGRRRRLEIRAERLGAPVPQGAAPAAERARHHSIAPP
jgi:hypothetical protein